jgi:hypothetical protein
MTRPIYETPDDLHNEADVLRLISQLWPSKFHKLPIRYHLDYAATKDNGAVVAYLEIKVRKHSMDQIDKWGGYMLSLAKLQTAEALCRISKAVFVLVVKCPEGVYWSKISDFTQFPVVIAGRTDRGDSQDVEPCVMIPTKLFIPLAS